MTKISIITASWNQGEYIERTIKSIVTQTGDFELEYIIIDGLSTDNSVEIIKKYEKLFQAKKFPNLVKYYWVSEKDHGQTDAINKGLKMATGDIVAFLNSDDAYSEGALDQVINFFQKNSQIKWLYGKCQIINEQDQEILTSITKVKNFLLRNYSYFKLLTINFISQPATFWRKEVMAELGYLDPKQFFVMDYEYWLRLGKKYPAGVINQYLANFRRYSESKSGSGYRRQFWHEWLVAAKYAWKKWYGILTMILHCLTYILIVGGYTLLGATNAIFRKK